MQEVRQERLAHRKGAKSQSVNHLEEVNDARRSGYVVGTLTRLCVPGDCKGNNPEPSTPDP